MSCGCGTNYNIVGGAPITSKPKPKRWTPGKMSKADLIEHAKKHKIPYYNKLNKEQLEKEITKARNKK